MAYAYRSSNSAGNASGGALAVSNPSGLTDGDLLVAIAYLEDDTNTWSSVPSGWNAGPAIANTGIFKLWSYWKIASSEPASWTWTPNTSNWRTIVVAAYTGATGSGTSRVDVSSTAQGDGVTPASNQTAPTVTTTADGDLVVFGYGNFSGTNVSTLTGFSTNMRVSFGGATIGDAVKTPAGATGTTAPNAGPGTEDYAAMHVAFFLDTGGGGGGLVRRLVGYDTNALASLVG